MLKNIAIIALYATFTSASAQGFQPEGDISDEMVPEGWEYISSITGDLNNDGRADLFIMASPGTKPVAAVYFDNGNDKWTLHSQYDNAFRDMEQMEYTPEYNMEIDEKGNLKIELYDPDQFEITIQSSYTFKMKDGELMLVHEEHDGNASPIDKSKKLGDFEIN